MADHATRLLVIDGTNLFHRSYHALVHQALASGNEPTFAVFGTINTIASTFREHMPTHAVVVFDWGKSEYRLGIWPKYKAGRPTSDVVDMDDVGGQMGICQNLIPHFGIQVWKERNVEADDIMGTIVERFKNEVDETIVVSGDKDMRQLIDKTVVVIHPSMGAKPEQRWDYDRVMEHYGVPPERLPEVWALSGDKIDNIPGVPGIGEKTAIKFIAEYGDLEKVALSDEKKVQGYRHDINMSYRLVKLNPELTDFPLILPAIRFVPVEKDDVGAEKLRSILNELGFDSVVSRWSNGTLWQERGTRLRDLKSK